MQPYRRVQPAVRKHPREMSSLKNEHDPKENILLAIVNDDAETVAELATDTLKAEKITVQRTPDPMYCMASLGMLCYWGKTYQGLKLEDGQTLLDIARSNKKQAAIGALLDCFGEGDAVEADYHRHGHYYAGKITSVREDGSYDVLYDDGDAEACVAPESVRRRSEEPEAARPETGEPAFSVGDAVDARYRGRAKTYPGAIERVHEDATYDILYEDGEREARVAEALISKRWVYTGRDECFGTRAKNCQILLAIANDDAEAVARLATNELKAEKIVCERTPDYAYTMGSFGFLQAYGKTYHGLKLGGGQTLLDIAQSNNKQAAVGALLP